MKVIRTQTSEMFFDEHGILHKTVIEDCHVDLQALKESDKATKELTKGKKVLILYDARNHFTLTEDAMEHAQNDIFSKQRIATAIISTKTAIKITVDHMNNIMKSTVPIKIFTTKKDALKWLLTFKEKNSKKKVVHKAKA